MVNGPKIVTTIDNCNLINLPDFSDERGGLIAIEKSELIQFEINRVYYFFNTSSAHIVRGEHAHLNLKQLIIAISGSFDIEIDDGKEKHVYHLNSPNHGLYICPMIWREITNFSDGTVGLVLASEKYNSGDYISTYDEFLKLKQ